jgi:hypothetical protein
MAGRTPRSAYCVAQLLNTSKEDIKLQAGKIVAQVNEVEEGDITGDDETTPACVNGKQVHPATTPQSEGTKRYVPTLIDEKLTYLCSEKKGRFDQY